MKVAFSPPRIDDLVVEAVSKALRSGWITTGPRTKLLEEKISAYCGNPKSICLNSATAGMELILRLFGIGPGDEVIVPAYTYCATANVVVHCGAKVVFVDCRAEDFNISVPEIRKAITAHTKAIIPVDFAGFPCDYDEINALVNEAEIKSLFKPTSDLQAKLGRILVLSDAAHSFGAQYKGRHTGVLCDVSVFSFHAVKNLTTAEGGAVSLNFPSPIDNEEIYKDLNRMSLHGQSKDAMAKFSGKASWEYDVLEAGYKCNMTDIHAAIGLIEIERYDEENLAARKYIFDVYSAAFSEYECFQIPVYETEEKTTSYHVYPLRIKNITEAQRNGIIELIFEKEVSVNVHFKPVPMMTAYINMGYSAEDYPNALQNFRSEISLPVYYDLGDEKINLVIDAVLESVTEVIGELK
jgi:dTDP-4-amino-4,6-dideoxygalactose transaminase